MPISLSEALQPKNLASSRGCSYDLAVASEAARRRGLSYNYQPDFIAKEVCEVSSLVQMTFPFCESPIERRMLVALAFSDYGDKFVRYLPHIHLPKEDKNFPTQDLIIIPQFAFVKHRLDFAIIGKCEGQHRMIGIECDGKKFHPDSVNDRVRDHERDTYLKCFNIDVFRFSGKAIQADPRPLAQQAANAMLEWRASLI